MPKKEKNKQDKQPRGIWVCIFLGIQRLGVGVGVGSDPSKMFLVQKLAKQISLSLSFFFFFFFFNLNCVTGEILSQGESIPEPSLGRGKIFQLVRNEADVTLRRKKNSAGGKEKGGKRHQASNRGALNSRWDRRSER